jgi:hypothetical protein
VIVAVSVKSGRKFGERQRFKVWELRQPPIFALVGVEVPMKDRSDQWKGYDSTE